MKSLILAQNDFYREHTKESMDRYLAEIEYYLNNGLISIGVAQVLKDGIKDEVQYYENNRE